MADTQIFPTSENMKRVYTMLDCINTVDIRNYLEKIYDNWKNIYPYFDRHDSKRNIDLRQSGIDLDDILSEYGEINNKNDKEILIREKIPKILENLQKIYGNNINIYLHNNNADSKSVGSTSNMGYTDGSCKIFAYIKKSTDNTKIQQTPKSELQHIRIFHCSEKKIRYCEENESGNAEDKVHLVNSNDYLVFDNFYNDHKFETNYVSFKEIDMRIRRKRERLEKKGKTPDEIEKKISDYKERVFSTEESKYNKHLYNYIYFEKEIEFYIKKTQSEYYKVTSNSNQKSYYRMIYYHLESVKSLDKMILQRLQLSHYRYFYSNHSWWRSITGFGTTTSDYYKKLDDFYKLIMGDLKSKPLNILEQFEQKFPKKINKLNNIISNFALKELYLHASNQPSEKDKVRAQKVKIENQEKIENIKKNMKKLWQTVKII